VGTQGRWCPVPPNDGGAAVAGMPNVVVTGLGAPKPPKPPSPAAGWPPTPVAAAPRDKMSVGRGSAPQEDPVWTYWHRMRARRQSQRLRWAAPPALPPRRIHRMQVSPPPPAVQTLREEADIGERLARWETRGVSAWRPLPGTAPKPVGAAAVAPNVGAAAPNVPPPNMLCRCGSVRVRVWQQSVK
jgi:hypothetical protein